MYLLDTSVVSNFLDERRYYPQLTARIINQPPEQIFISIITVEEILQGALASIQKAKRTPSVTKAYQYFEDLFAALHRFQILSYTSEAENIYQSLPAKSKRIGTQDCRIAAIAHVNEFTVVTVNVKDFVSIGLTEVEDWTR
ncbi:MAG: type II toxin-antitoxin system VapC family toxin [Xenococcaceae cyanobacterium MO_188.B32]|nr:type II toxin-antitoxin system VapC family toxin [Xenococcaceae cyanobacterium MO_188.B32]